MKSVKKTIANQVVSACYHNNIKDVVDSAISNKMNDETNAVYEATGIKWRVWDKLLAK